MPCAIIDMDIEEVARFLEGTDLFKFNIGKAFPSNNLTQYDIQTPVSQFHESVYHKEIVRTIESHGAQDLPQCLRAAWYTDSLLEACCNLKSCEELEALAEKTLAHLLIGGFVQGDLLISARGTC